MQGRDSRLEHRGTQKEALVAISREGEEGYNLVTMNCEHFCLSCFPPGFEHKS